MPTKIPDSPLAGAAPILQPTARPYAVQPGATPAARSPLADLANAFQNFNGPLSDMLRTRAAQADHDAETMGSLKAQELAASNHLGDIEGMLKQQVDSGQIAAFRTPAFERGFRARVGSEFAKTSFQEDLMGQLQSVSTLTGAPGEDTSLKTHAAKVEQTIKDTYSKYASQLNPGDLYAREAFDGVAQGVISGFRARAIDSYSQQYAALGEQKIADDLTARVYALAEAPAADVQKNVDNVMSGLNFARSTELPAAGANKFFIERAVAPAVQQLITEKKFDAALTMLDRVRALDVTGKGGLLGKTSDGAVLGTLTEQVIEHSRTNLGIEWDTKSTANKMSVLDGQNAAVADLEKMRTANGGSLVTAKKDDLVKSFAAAHVSDPVSVDAYRDTVEKQYDFSEKEAYDPKHASDLLLAADSLDPKQIEATRTALDAGFHSGSISPQARVEIEDHLRAAEEMKGLTSESDFTNFRIDLYGKPRLVNGVVVASDGVDFGDGGGEYKDPNSTSKRWGNLAPALKVQHEQDTAGYFAKVYQDKIRQLGSRQNATPEALTKARMDATVEARKYAISRLATLTELQTKQDTKAKVDEQAARIRRATISNGFDVIPHLSGFSLPAGADPTKGKFFSTFPAAGQRGPAPEADQATVYIPATTLGEFVLPGMNGKPNVVNLPALAKAITEEPDPAKAAKDQEVYGYVKGRLGFTPEEIKAGVTKHGIPFRASKIDPEHIAVFRNRAELERHWANGKPDDTFVSVGNAVDPIDRYTAEQFYLAQLALFSSRN